MDQAALLSILSNLYDKLVADVAERVKQTTELSPETDMEKLREVVTPLINEITDVSIESWADTYMDDRIERWIDENLDMEDAARRALENSDSLADIIRDTVKDSLTFTVSVD